MSRQQYVIIILITILMVLIMMYSLAAVDSLGLSLAQKAAVCVCFCAISVSVICGAGSSKNVIRGFVFVFASASAIPFSLWLKVGCLDSVARPLRADLQIGLIHLVCLVLILYWSADAIGRGSVRLRVRPIEAVFLLLVTLCFASSLYPWNANPTATLTGVSFLAVAVIIVLIAPNVIPPGGTFKPIWNGFAAAALIETALVTAYPVLGMDEVVTWFSKSAIYWANREGIARAVGTTDHPGDLAIYLAMILPFFVAGYALGYRRRWSIFLTFVIFVDIVLTGSRAGTAAGVVGGALAYVLCGLVSRERLFGRRVVGSAAIFLVLVALTTHTAWGQRTFMSENFSNMSLVRYYYVGLGWEMFTDHPITGIGFNSHVDYMRQNIYITSFPILGPEFVYQNPIHNSHLIILCEIGILGYILWLLLFLLLIRAALTLGKKSRITRDTRGAVVGVGVIGSSVAYLTYAFTGWATLKQLTWHVVLLNIILLTNHMLVYSKSCCRASE